MITIKKLPIRIMPSSARKLIRPFIPGNPTHVEHIIFRIFSIPTDKRRQILDSIYDSIDVPRPVLEEIFVRHYENVRDRIPSDSDLDDDMQQLIGAFFTQQYALESTALFNPSIVPHPVQDKPGITRFIMSLRAIGEGHISSITFKEGEIDANLNVSVNDNSPFIQEPERYAHLYDRALFIKKANELGLLSELNRKVFDHLSDRFNFSQLQETIDDIRKSNVSVNTHELANSLNNIRTLALSNFTLQFSTNDITERAIYPASPSQSNGLEDARFVKFTEDDGSSRYYATFTAYDGRTIMPEMLETDNFTEFRVSTLNGPVAKGKGMALFPRRVNGAYMMISRQDGESMYIMESDNPYFWYDCRPLLKPTYSWEAMLLGNCGSPIEIDEGWLVITHGVGAVRSYSLGAMLLDKNKPWHVLGRLHEPLLEPTKEERGGYVPNVVYSCGSMAIGRTLILPYAIGDVITTFALISIDEIVSKLKD